MKYAHFLFGLLAGTALGSAVVASTGSPLVGMGGDKDAIKQIVRETIAEEPKLILETLQKFNETQRKEQMASAGEVLKDSAVREQVFNPAEAPSVGPKDSTRVVVEFFDYNCPACKFMFKGLDELIQKDKTARVIFREYPIFGPQSETNAKFGLAVNRLYPEKYLDFHRKMMMHEGRVDEAGALAIIKELGMDEAKVKTESVKPDITDLLAENAKLGKALQIQGTPTLAVGDKIIPHAVSFEELEAALAGDAKPEEAKQPQ